MRIPKTQLIALLCSTFLLAAALGTAIAQDGETVPEDAGSFTPPSEGGDEANRTETGNETAGNDTIGNEAPGEDAAGSDDTPTSNENETAPDEGTPTNGTGDDTASETTPEGNETESGNGNGDDADDTGNETDSDPTEPRRKALWTARKAALASFHENRSRILQEYRDALQAARVSFLENKSAVIEGCRGDEANKTDRVAFAKCVRDGLAPLKDEARAAMREARETAHEALKEYRGKSLAKFQGEKARVDRELPPQAAERQAAADGHASDRGAAQREAAMARRA